MKRLLMAALSVGFIAIAGPAAWANCPQCVAQCTGYCDWADPYSMDHFRCYHTCMPACSAHYCPMSGL
jgi:hypothetical protein